MHARTPHRNRSRPQEAVETKLQGERFEADSKVYLKKLWAEATIWVSPKYQDRLSPSES
jgi:hypothetical protein